MSDQTMRVVGVDGGRGPAAALRIERRPIPAPGPGQVLIRVAAAGVNRPDVLQRLGLYPPPAGASDVLGLEVAGEAAALGEGVETVAPGERVCALLTGGGYAEYALADAGSVLPIPRGLDAIQAAALPETVFTVRANVFEAGGLKAGETLVVHGATSGIGATAIALGRAAGAMVIATSRGADKAAQALALGASHAVDASARDWAAAVSELGGADVILDMVGGTYVEAGIGVLKPGGRLVVIAFQGGAEAKVDLRLLMTRRLTLTGSTLRARPAQEKARLAAAVRREIWPMLEEGRARVPVAATFPLERAAEAHARMEAGDFVGKIVLTV